MCVPGDAILDAIKPDVAAVDYILISAKSTYCAFLEVLGFIMLCNPLCNLPCYTEGQVGAGPVYVPAAAIIIKSSFSPQKPHTLIVLNTLCKNVSICVCPSFPTACSSKENRSKG